MHHYILGDVTRALKKYKTTFLTVMQFDCISCRHITCLRYNPSSRQTFEPGVRPCSNDIRIGMMYFVLSFYIQIQAKYLEWSPVTFEHFHPDPVPYLILIQSCELFNE